MKTSRLDVLQGPEYASAVKLTDNKLVITDFILNNEYIYEVEEIRKKLTKKRWTRISYNV